MRVLGLILCAAALIGAGAPKPAPKPLPVPEPTRTPAEIIAAAKDSEWRDADPNWTLVLELAGGKQVILELAPVIAPANADNVRELAKLNFYDGLTIYRSQDNYVVQMGMEPTPKPIPQGASASVTGEPVSSAKDVPFTLLPYADGYAPQVGFSNGLPVGRDPNAEQIWLAHCYGAVGMSRDNDINSGGTDFYVVTGHAPRHLDRNITLFGRVLLGMEHLTTLPRGTEALGFYKTAEERVRITSVRVLADLPLETRPNPQVMRTEGPLWAEYMRARANRKDSWFIRPANHVELCNVLIPTRLRPKESQAPAPEAP
jgi:cyclophilin family peptidyl-prolyl cis-trans isomerase